MDDYYVLTDRINGGTIIKDTDSGQFKYNIGTGQWEITTVLWDYTGAFDSPYEGLYQQITKKKAEQIIAKNKERWKKQWNIAKTISQTQYAKIASPIRGIMYADYVMLLSDYASDERERIILVLSGLPLTGTSWKSVASKYGVSPELVEALDLWHTATRELFQEHNRWVLQAVMTELKYLNSRKDLYHPRRIASRYMMLTKGFSKEEVYSGVTL